MLRENDQIPDLKINILELKKEIAILKETNRTITVKNRKLQNEVTKRDKQIEALLDPRKSNLMKKVLSEKGASIVLNLQEKNHKLEKSLAEKKALVSRLRNELKAVNLYAKPGGNKKRYNHKLGVELSKLTVDSSYSEFYCSKRTKLPSPSCSNLESAKESATESVFELTSEPSFTSLQVNDNNKKPLTTPKENVAKDFYKNFTHKELVSIIEDLKHPEKNKDQNENSEGKYLDCESQNSDLERNELYSETPHKEIQQLQTYFLDMLTEVDQLKLTISELKMEQMNTARILKQKDSNMEHLEGEVKNLKKTQSAYKSSAGKKKTKYGSKSGTSKLSVYENKADKKLEKGESRKEKKHQKICKIPLTTESLCTNEQERRKETFNNLMEQMLQSTIKLRNLSHGDD